MTSRVHRSAGQAVGRYWFILAVLALACGQSSQPPREEPGVARARLVGGPLGGSGGPPTDSQSSPEAPPAEAGPDLIVTADLSSIAGRVVKVGDTLSLQLRIVNHGSAAATGVSATLTAPAEAAWTDNSPQQRPISVGAVAAQDEADVPMVLRVTSLPADGVLSLHAELSATELTSPLASDIKLVVTSAEAAASRSVVAAADGSITGKPTGAQPAHLENADGSIQVDFPAGATKVDLTLRYATEPPGGMVPALPMPMQTRRSFGAFYLTAEDARQNPVTHFDKPLTLRVRYTEAQLAALDIAESQLGLFYFDPAAVTDEATGSTGRWIPIPTSVDPATHVATVQVDHFTAFELGDLTKASEAYLPSLQGFNVDLATGGANYSYELELPAGAGGMKPDVALSYSSAATDGPAGSRRMTQSSWVGKGMTLEPAGTISVNHIDDDSPESGTYYTVVVGGKSFDLLRGRCFWANGQRTTTPQPPNNCSMSIRFPEQWDWIAADREAIRARVDITGMGDPHPDPDPNNRGRGVQDFPRRTWTVWLGDGKKYVFADDAWWGWDYDPSSQRLKTLEEYKWFLTEVVDANGNSIQYHYSRDTKYTTVNAGGGNRRGITVDWGVYLTEILWGGRHGDAPGTDGPRYRVYFDHRARSTFAMGNLGVPVEAIDVQPPGQVGGVQTPNQTRLLENIRVFACNPSWCGQDPAGHAWDRIRGVRFHYEPRRSAAWPTRTSMISDYGAFSGGGRDPDETTEKLTLKSIEPLGKESGQVLPSTTLTYGLPRGTPGALYSRGDWNRLISATNGHGGRASFEYENAGAVLAAQGFDGRNFGNTRRVTAKSLDDGLGRPESVSRFEYVYQGPAFNWGSNDSHAVPANAAPTSAKLVALQCLAGNVQAVHRAWTELRGHRKVIERDPYGNETDHYFFVGDIPDFDSPPPANHNYCALDADPEFVKLAKYEFLKGKEYRTVVRRGGTQEVLHQADTTYALNSVCLHRRDNGFQRPSGVCYGQGHFDQQIGLWYSAVYPSRVDNTSYDPGGSMTVRVEKGVENHDLPEYDSLAKVPGYGRLLEKQTSVVGASPATIRIERQTYARPLNPDAVFITDRIASKLELDGATGKFFTAELTLYDGRLDDRLDVRGLPTLVRKLSNLTASTVLSGPYQGIDSQTTYDAYGNVVTATTFAGYGSSSFTGGTWANTANGSAARTTLTEYDPYFHAYPTAMHAPRVGGQEIVQIQATYDFRMGQPIQLVDQNGETTRAKYDRFGRVIGVYKHDDVPFYGAFPPASNDEDVNGATIAAGYLDFAFPMQYSVVYREQSGYGGPTRDTTQFFDGMGRAIQSKIEYGPGQMEVTSTRYDKLGRTVEVSQPEQQPNGPYWSYVPPPSPMYRSTVTTYDAQGRTLTVTRPGLPAETFAYGMTVDTTNGALPLRTILQTDASGRKTRRDLDGFDQPRRISELSRTGQLLSQTRIDPEPANQRLVTTDPNGKVSIVTHDSAGRRIGGTDVTLGSFSFTYDPASRVTSQIDARGLRIDVLFDELGRVSQRTHVGANPSEVELFTYDDTTGGNPALGKRTMSRRLVGGAEVSKVQWRYDLRGREVRRTQWVNGTAYAIAKTYDTANRVTAVTYPSNEQVTYTFDNGWHQKSACSSLGTCYAYDARYNALQQPEQISLGGGPATELRETFQYDLNGRLSRFLIERYVNGALSATMTNRSYGFDEIGNILTIANHNANTEQLQYDDLSRLTSWSKPAQNGNPAFNESYSYDLMGNFVTKAGSTYQYDANASGYGGPYAVRSVNGGPQWSYDAAGNVLAGDGKTYTWNHAGRLKSVTGPNGVTSDARFLWQNVPSSVSAGERFTVTVAVRNAGNSTWTAAQGFRLGSQNPQDNTRWGVSRVYLQAGESVAPGQQKIFTFQVTAPQTAGPAAFQWRMLQEGVAWFGDYTPSLTVNVRPNGSQFVSQSAPIWVFAGAPFTATVTLRNTGTTPWSEGALIRLGSQNPQDNTTWGVSRVSLGAGESIPPGQSKTFTLQGTAPSVSGVYDFQWQMLQEGVEWFGERTRNLRIAVCDQGGPSQQQQPICPEIYGNEEPQLDPTSAAPIAVDQPGAPEVQVTETFTYDADGQRESRTVEGVTTWYVGGVYELEGTKTRTLYELAGKVIAQREVDTAQQTNTLVYLHHDHLGSVVLVTRGTGAIGTELSRQDYDPWGLRLSPGSGYQQISQTRLSFNGQRLDVTGLLYFNARYYDPLRGRFISPDSVVPGGEHATSQSFNRFAYVMNNPVTFRDPTGHEPEQPNGSGGGTTAETSDGMAIDHDTAAGLAAVLEKLSGDAKDQAEYAFETILGDIVGLPVKDIAMALKSAPGQSLIQTLVDTGSNPQNLKQVLDHLKTFVKAVGWGEKVSEAAFRRAENFLGGVFIGRTIGNGISTVVMMALSDQLKSLAQAIKAMNGPGGIVLSYHIEGNILNYSDHWEVKDASAPCRKANVGFGYIFRGAIKNNFARYGMVFEDGKRVPPPPPPPPPPACQGSTGPAPVPAPGPTH